MIIPPQQPTLLFFLHTCRAPRDGNLRLERSWLEDSIGFPWSRLPFMDVLVMTLELVLARKAVVATVLAPKDRAWELILVEAGAMLGLVVALEVPKALGNDMTILL